MNALIMARVGCRAGNGFVMCVGNTLTDEEYIEDISNTWTKRSYPPERCPSRSNVNLISVLALALLTIILGSREGRSAEAGRAEDAQSIHARAGTSLRIGDKINLAVFERIEHQEDKWASHQRLPDLSRSFVQRLEVSGERTVQDDGGISLPFLGQVPVAGLTGPELETAVAKAFEAVFHRPAFVTVLSVEHRPIYIAGPVKNPGSYKYSPGITVLHAIALAGGLERPAEETWRAIGAVQEGTKVENARTAVSRTLARVAVLRAERDVVPVTIPPRLVRLLGEQEAAAIVSDEKALRSLVLSTRQAREAALASAVEAAKNELDLANARVAPLEANIKLRTDRFNALTSLSMTGVASRAQVTEVQTALFDVESRRQEALGALAAAKHRLAKAEQEVTQFHLENQSQLEIEIDGGNKTIADNITTIESGTVTLHAIQVSLARQMQLAKKTEYLLEIVRRTADGNELIQATELTELEPGDLVRLKPPSEKEQMSMRGN